MKINRIATPKGLKRGSRIGVVAPGYALPEGSLEPGLRWLSRQGYEVCVGDNVTGQSGYLAGEDSARLADLESFWLDPTIDALWFARGGYGTARLLDQLPWRKLRSRPKLIIGYSDATALLNASLARTGVGGLLGPVVIELGDRKRFHRPSLKAGLAQESFGLQFRAKDVLLDGRAKGQLFGGNLCVLTHLCGTRFLPKGDDRILFLEEIGEPTYRVDRMLNQLRQAGLFSGLRAVLLGSFFVPERRHFPPDRDLDELFAEFFGPLNIPVVRELPVGHRNGMRTLPIGGQARIDTKRRRATFLPQGR